MILYYSYSKDDDDHPHHMEDDVHDMIVIDFYFFASFPHLHTQHNPIIRGYFSATITSIPVKKYETFTLFKTFTNPFIPPTKHILYWANLQISICKYKMNPSIVICEYTYCISKRLKADLIVYHWTGKERNTDGENKLTLEGNHAIIYHFHFFFNIALHILSINAHNLTWFIL